jgi:membrane-associated phospholipid phosphatase
MLAGTVTEGAHYLTDVVAGSAMAFFAYYLARYTINKEDAWSIKRAADAVADPRVDEAKGLHTRRAGSRV